MCEQIHCNLGRGPSVRGVLRDMVNDESNAGTVMLNQDGVEYEVRLEIKQTSKIEEHPDWVSYTHDKTEEVLDDA